jgi:hypothetical protein
MPKLELKSFYNLISKELYIIPYLLYSIRNEFSKYSKGREKKNPKKQKNKGKGIKFYLLKEGVLKNFGSIFETIFSIFFVFDFICFVIIYLGFLFIFLL